MKEFEKEECSHEYKGQRALEPVYSDSLKGLVEYYSCRLCGKQFKVEEVI